MAVGYPQTVVFDRRSKDASANRLGSKELAGEALGALERKGSGPIQILHFMTVPPATPHSASAEADSGWTVVGFAVLGLLIAGLIGLDQGLPRRLWFRHIFFA
jgi:hypothetical protein